MQPLSVSFSQITAISHQTILSFGRSISPVISQFQSMYIKFSFAAIKQQWQSLMAKHIGETWQLSLAVVASNFEPQQLQIKVEVRRSFNATSVCSWEHWHPRSHHKGAAAGRVRTGDRRYPVPTWTRHPYKILELSFSVKTNASSQRFKKNSLNFFFVNNSSLQL